MWLFWKIALMPLLFKVNAFSQVSSEVQQDAVDISSSKQGHVLEHFHLADDV